jgi:hypothetical protein
MGVLTTMHLETKRNIHCPVAHDDSGIDCDWPERLRAPITEDNIMDFSDWKDEDKFRCIFARLLEGLIYTISNNRTADVE